MRPDKAGGPRAFERGGVDERAGRVRRAVDAVGADTGQHRRRAERRQRRRAGQGEFLVPPADAVARHADGGLAARDNARGTTDVGRAGERRSQMREAEDRASPTTASSTRMT